MEPPSESESDRAAHLLGYDVPDLPVHPASDSNAHLLGRHHEPDLPVHPASDSNAHLLGPHHEPDLPIHPASNANALVCAIRNLPLVLREVQPLLCLVRLRCRYGNSGLPCNRWRRAYGSRRPVAVLLTGAKRAARNLGVRSPRVSFAHCRTDEHANGAGTDANRHAHSCANSRAQSCADTGGLLQ